MFRHLLPNAMVATMTFLPFILSGSVMTLTALDFLGFGLPPGSPSLGELLSQAKANIQAPWLGFTGFFTVAIMLSLLIFMGEAVRDAFDPRKAFGVTGMDATTTPLLPSATSQLRSAGREAVARGRPHLVRHQARRDRRAGRRVRLGQVGVGTLDPELLPYPSASHPSGSVRFKGEELLSLPERQIRRVRGQ